MNARLPFAILSLLCCLGAAACDRYPYVEDGEILSVRVVCPDGREECPAIANGVSVVGIEACTSAEDRREGLKALLRVAPLEWQNPPDLNQRSLYTASLSGNPCVTATFVTRTSPDLVRVDAELGGFRTDPIWIQTIPTNVSSIELLPQPAVLNVGQTTTMKLNTMVLASNGKVTLGTRVFFDVVSVEPQTGTATVWPGSAQVDLARTPPTAEATLVTGPSVTSAVLRMSAVPPDVEGAATADTIVREFTVTGTQ